MIILNEGEDLFIMSNIDENGSKTFLCYIKEFKNKERKNIKQIKIKRIYDYEIINNQNNICVKTNKTLYFINKNKIKEINLPQDEIQYNNMINNNMNNPMINNNMNNPMINNNMMNNPMINNIYFNFYLFY